MYYYDPYSAGYVYTGTTYSTESMIELYFPSHSNVVGHIIGRDSAYLKQLVEEYSRHFGGRVISVTYDGSNFRVHLDNFQPGITFVLLDFARRVSLANEGIYAQPAGAIIGKGGWWLRKASESQSEKCTIYHEDGLFFVRFPWNVRATERVRVMDRIRRQIMGRAAYFQKSFQDTDSQSSASTIGYCDSVNDI